MLLRPSLRVDAVHDVTPEILAQHRVRAVMIDLDDTLVASGSDYLDPLYRNWLDALKDAGIDVLLLSNGKRDRVDLWAQTLGVRGLALVGKPFTFAFRRGLELLGRPAAETAMVGDQLFTDVLGANLVGVLSILVTPLSPGGLPHTRAVRRLEKIILGGSRGSTVHR